MEPPNLEEIGMISFINRVSTFVYCLTII